MGTLPQKRTVKQKRNLQGRCEGQIGNEETYSHTVTDVHSDPLISVICGMDEGRWKCEWRHLLCRFWENTESWWVCLFWDLTDLWSIFDNQFFLLLFFLLHTWFMSIPLTFWIILFLKKVFSNFRHFSLQSFFISY